MKRYSLLGPLFYMLLFCAIGSAQTLPLPASALPQTPAQPADVGAQIAQLRSNYVMRPGDQIIIHSEMDEISEKPLRIDADGFIDLPTLGRVKFSDISLETMEGNLVEALKKYIKTPHVAITVVQFSSDPIFFIGAFRVPSIYPLVGQRNLVEMIASVGGLQAGASKRIKVTRRAEYGPIPLPNVVTLPDGTGTSVQINIKALQANVNPAEDIVLKPYDVISAELVESIYTAGEFSRTGAFPLNDKDSLSVLQLLATCGGVATTGNPKKAYILRPIGDTARRAVIPLDIERIIKGQGNDVPLLPNDVVYVAKSKGLQGKELQLWLPFIGIATTIITLLVRFE
jgi:protein involved in polysaccharide export with SLBB domain